MQVKERASAHRVGWTHTWDKRTKLLEELTK